MNYEVGTKSEAVCFHCQGIQPTTYQMQDVAIRDENKVVKHILVAVCDKCQNVVGIPHSSVEEIKSQRDVK